MSWADELLFMTETGGRAWAHWMEERWHAHRARHAEQWNHRPYRSEFTGRFCHPVAAMLRRRILRPEWTWDVERYGSGHDRDPETEERVAVYARAALEERAAS